MVDEYIRKKIGIAAMLEQLAEESSELSQAALKLARKLRNENPTPKSYDACVDNLLEEIADVKLCIRQLPEDIIDTDIIRHIMVSKYKRWVKRLREHDIARYYDEGCKIEVKPNDAP